MQKDKKSIFYIFFSLYSFLSLSNLFCQNIDVIAMNSFKPFAYSNENNEPAGISVFIVKKLLDKAEITTTPIKIYPLKRVFNILDSNNNTLAFALFRTPERESKYKWIVPVTFPIKSVFIKLADRTDIQIDSLEDANKYTIGVICGNNLHSFLLEKGFSSLETVTRNEQNYKKLFTKRVDLIAGRDTSIKSELIDMGYSKDDISVVYQVVESQPAWLVSNNNFSDDIIEQIKTAYEQFIIKENVLKILNESFYDDEE